MIHSISHMITEFFVCLGVQTDHIFQLDFYSWWHSIHYSGSKQCCHHRISLWLAFQFLFPSSQLSLDVGGWILCITNWHSFKWHWVHLRWVFSSQSKLYLSPMFVTWGRIHSWIVSYLIQMHPSKDLIHLGYSLAFSQQYVLMFPITDSLPVVSSSSTLIHFSAPLWILGGRAISSSRSWLSQGIYCSCLCLIRLGHCIGFLLGSFMLLVHLISLCFFFLAPSMALLPSAHPQGAVYPEMFLYSHLLGLVFDCMFFSFNSIFASSFLRACFPFFLFSLSFLVRIAHWLWLLS